MTKLIALITAGLFAAGTMFGDCDQGCRETLGRLKNVTAEQKTQMEAALEVFRAAGCTDASYTTLGERAKSILGEEEFLAFRRHCLR